MLVVFVKCVYKIQTSSTYSDLWKSIKRFPSPFCANEFVSLNLNKSPTAGTIRDGAGHFVSPLLYVGM